MCVLQWVEREIAPLRHEAVAGPVGEQRVRELVQGQRDEPTAEHEKQRVDGGVAELVPGHQPARDPHPKQTEEDRGRPEGRPAHWPARRRLIRYSTRSSSTRTAVTTPLASRSR